MSKLQAFSSLECLGISPPAIEAQELPDGGWLLRYPQPLREYPRSLLHALHHNVLQHPERIALAERHRCGREGWRTLDYKTLWGQISALALYFRNSALNKPVVMLSGNSIEHAVVRLAAMLAGQPAVPVSPGYSLQAVSFEKLHHVITVVDPGVIFVQNTGDYGRALTSLDNGVPVLAVNDTQEVADWVLSQVINAEECEADFSLLDEIDSDAAAQFMFTSGSTGMPKAVVHTHRNLVVAATQAAQVFQANDVVEEPQCATSWLPWHHVSGMATLYNTLMGGHSFFLDHGKPLPSQFEETLKTLKEVSPTSYISVPVGYQQLVKELEQDRGFATQFFHKVRYLIFGGAGIAGDTLERFKQLALECKGEIVPFISAYGSTETTASITFTYFNAELQGLIGLPVPGVEIKLLPYHGKYEVRVKGENVSPGYFPPVDDLFDEQGYLRMGDLVEWYDKDDFTKGLIFAGRIAEEFKLLSGTWVSSSHLRGSLIELGAPLIQEIVVCGINRDYVSVMIWLNHEACRSFDESYCSGQPWLSSKLVGVLASKLADHNAHNPGSSTRIVSGLFMTEPLCAAEGEISDKGSVNSLRVQERRQQLLEHIYQGNLLGLIRF